MTENRQSPAHLPWGPTHTATCTAGNAIGRPVNIQCDCGTGGDFGSVEEAEAWITEHHFNYLRGINDFAFVDETPGSTAGGLALAQSEEMEDEETYGEAEQEDDQASEAAPGETEGEGETGGTEGQGGEGLEPKKKVKKAKHKSKRHDSSR